MYLELAGDLMHRWTYMNVVCKFSIMNPVASNNTRLLVHTSVGLIWVQGSPGWEQNVGRVAFLLEALKNNRLPKSSWSLAFVKMVPTFL